MGLHYVDFDISKLPVKGQASNRCLQALSTGILRTCRSRKHLAKILFNVDL